MTKLYLTNNTPAVANPVGGIGWNRTTGRVFRALGEVKGGTPTNNVATDAVTTSPYLVAHGIWISDRQVVSPRDLTLPANSIKMYFGARESSTAADASFAFGLYMINAAGTLRRVGGGGGWAAAELPTTAAGRLLNFSDAFATITGIEVGDRVMVDVGVRFTNTVSTSYTTTLFYGGTGSDITETSTGTGVTTTTSASRLVPYIDIDSPDFDPLFASARSGDHFHSLATG